MKIIKADRDRLSEISGVVVDHLKQGKIVVLPTDTSYGLCANAYDEKAVRRVFAIKKRPAAKPLSVIIRDLAMLAEVAEVRDKELAIIKKHLPGPFTFVLPKKDIIPDIVSGGGDTIGARMPDFPLIQEIMKGADFPLTATSANISGEAAIYSTQDLMSKFAKNNHQPEIIVDIGTLPQNQPSTIVDLTDDLPRILRAGSGKFSL